MSWSDDGVKWTRGILEVGELAGDRVVDELRVVGLITCEGDDASMTIGISTDQEVCQIFGQVSHNLLNWKKNLPTEKCGPGGD